MKQSLETVNFIYQLGLGARPRSKLASFTIGKVIADTLSLPSGSVDDISGLYRLTHQEKTNQIIGALNELVPVDYALIQDYVKRMYLTRYNIIFAQERKVYLFKSETAVSDFFGVGVMIDPETIKLIQDNTTELSFIYNGMTRFVNEYAAWVKAA